MRTPALALVAALAMPLSAQTHPFSIDDILKMQQIQSVIRSPDGEAVAVVVIRPTSAGEMYLRQLRGYDRADLWLVTTKDGAVKKLTNGVKDQSGFWSPSWSPDGKRLAFYTVTGNGPIRLGVWDRASGTIKIMTDRSVDPYLRLGGGFQQTIRWLSDKTVLVSMFPPGATGGRERGQLSITDNAVAGWKKTERGAEPAISVVTSGSVKGDAYRDSRSLSIVDVSIWKATPILDTTYQDVSLSPDQRRLAVTVDLGMRQPRAGRPFGFNDSRLWKLGVVTLANPKVVRWVAGVHTAGSPVPSWSPDGTRLALIGAPRDEASADVALVAPIDGDTVKAVLPVGWAARSIAWSSNNELLVLATQPSTSADEKAAKPPRADWYLASDAGAPRNLTASMKTAPGSLRRAAGSMMVGIADDTLWSLDVAAAAAKALTPGIAKVTSIVWPDAEITQDQLVVQAGERTAPTLHRVMVTTGSASPLPMPNPAAALKTFDPKTSTSTFTGELPNGTYLWLGADASFRQVVALNEFLASVEAGRRMLVDYTGIEGDTLKALVVLPVGYQQGKRYPAVSWVYAGSVVRDTVDILLDKQEVHGLNLQTLAGAGYVVVVPSMPLAPDGTASDPYIDLPKGVIGAIDKLVAMGIVDPQKVGVMGQSYGGYSTMTLVTYTNRFKAAVELAGPPDLISFYTVFEPTARYDPNADESMFAPRWSETGQGRMGKPPWDDLWRYLRNSPLYYVERVNTPLLLLQGDLDFVSLIGGEQFFTALKRLGKPARFVRFWGEGHVLEAPANIRHQWKEIIDWFDTYLKGAGEKK